MPADAPISGSSRFGLVFVVERFAPVARASDAVPCQATCLSALLLVQPFTSRLLWLLLTSCSGSHRRPFRHKARSPQVRTRSFTAQPPDLRHLILDHKSFAVLRLLALIGTASYPVLVHRLAVSLSASSPRSVALTQLRFTSLAVASSREDLHLQGRWRQFDRQIWRRCGDLRGRSHN